MSERIEVGDLVMVIAPIQCCKNGKALGHVFTVAAFYDGKHYCRHCVEDLGSYRGAVDESGLCYHLSRLKRIPPLTEPETITERMEEPA